MWQEIAAWREIAARFQQETVMIDNPRESLQLLQASAEDIAWFESFGWRDDRVPPVTPQTLDDYKRREAMLNAARDGLTFSERGTSRAGQLAAAIGARIADFEDKASDEEED
jgi:hypothetical protein